MHSPLHDKSSNSPQLNYYISGSVGSWQTLFLYLFVTLIVLIASSSTRGEARLWQPNDSGPVISHIEYLPGTGWPTTRFGVQRISGYEDPGDQTRISPNAEGSFLFSTSPEGTMLKVPQATNSQPPLEEFRRTVMNGRPDQLTGIWVEDILAFRVQQGLTRRAPAVKNKLSIYKWAWQNGVVGLLIHNYSGGTQLYKLNPGVRIAAIYGNGGVDWYLSRGGTWYESRSGSSGGFTGPFRIWSCDTCSFDISVRELHNRHYSGDHRLAFQTCVYAEGRVGLVIIEAYLDWPPELQRTEVDPMVMLERYDPGMPKLYRGVVE
jgi:hypothetical protein